MMPTCVVDFTFAQAPEALAAFWDESRCITGGRRPSSGAKVSTADEDCLAQGVLRSRFPPSALAPRQGPEGTA